MKNISAPSENNNYVRRLRLLSSWADRNIPDTFPGFTNSSQMKPLLLLFLKNAEPRGAGGRDGAIRLTGLFLKKNKWVRNRRCCCSAGIKTSRSSGEHRPRPGQQKKFSSKDRPLQLEPFSFFLVLLFKNRHVSFLFCSQYIFKRNLADDHIWRRVCL